MSSELTDNGHQTLQIFLVVLGMIFASWRIASCQAVSLQAAGTAAPIKLEACVLKIQNEEKRHMRQVDGLRKQIEHMKAAFAGAELHPELDPVPDKRR